LKIAHDLHQVAHTLVIVREKFKGPNGAIAGEGRL